MLNSSEDTNLLEIILYNTMTNGVTQRRSAYESIKQRLFN